MDSENKRARKPDSESLFEEYADRVLAYINYRIDDPDCAEDLAAQVFERVLRSLDRYQPGPAPFEAWLFAIARNTVTDWWRIQRLRRFLSWDEIGQRPAAVEGPEEVAVRNEERRRVNQALSRLPAAERDLIALRFTSGLRNQEIARLVRKSDNHVAVSIFRILRKLRAWMETGELAADLLREQAEVNHE